MCTDNLDMFFAGLAEEQFQKAIEIFESGNYEKLEDFARGFNSDIPMEELIEGLEMVSTMKKCMESGFDL